MGLISYNIIRHLLIIWRIEYTISYGIPYNIIPSNHSIRNSYTVKSYYPLIHYFFVAPQQLRFNSLIIKRFGHRWINTSLRHCNSILMFYWHLAPLHFPYDPRVCRYIPCTHLCLCIPYQLLVTFVVPWLYLNTPTKALQNMFPVVRSHTTYIFKYCSLSLWKYTDTVNVYTTLCRWLTKKLSLLATL